ncbi:hypothetical protein [Marinimicrobium sp. ABcell2]|uniref:hypothetical protein n=1 Tax=Marinimicrobium sp. ABcell2 TaxID=3069751 RepID=UPI0027B6B6E5|nr:hypothetical protein [Marinimicrobium sp. ABcell2]MDQ2076474.1 hypothetical protein [Marinimicrobium sp. ABcell2]
MPLLQRLASRPLLPFCSAVIAVLGLVAGLLYWHHSQRNQELHLAHFGQSLANSAARQAVNPTLNQDLISLQVILQELTRHPSVSGATIHDVEHRLLVQSGSSPEEALSHSAPIALHNNIGGYLRIAMEPPAATAQDRQFFWLWSLAVLLAMAAPWAPDALGKFRVAAEEDTEEPLPEEPLGDPVTLRLALEIRNLPLLHRQLNLESFSQLVERLEEQLQGVLALYGGKRHALSQNWLLIDFEGHDISDCSLRALCSAWLLSELSSTNPGPKLRLGAHIYPLPEDDDASLVQELVAQLGDGAQQTTGIFLAPDLVDDDLLQHLQLDLDSGRLLDIQPPYKALLHKQQNQLQHLVGLASA